MNHETYLTQIDRFLDGELDVVEHNEFVAHKQNCRSCSTQLVERMWERLDERGTLIENPPQTCLTDHTIERWHAGDLPMELDNMVTIHLMECDACDRQSELIAERSLWDRPKTLTEPKLDSTSTITAARTTDRSLPNSFGLIAASQSATSDTLAHREATARTHASQYKLADQHGGIFELKTDREGRVFVVLSADTLTIAARSVVIKGEPYQLNRVADDAIEIQNLGESDLLDFADGFIVNGSWQS